MDNNGYDYVTVIGSGFEGSASALRLAENQLEYEKISSVDRIHVSLDVDGLDPTIAPVVGTPVPGGLTYREAHLLMETTADSNKLSSMDIVEINPMLDIYNETA